MFKKISRTSHELPHGRTLWKQTTLSLSSQFIDNEHDTHSARNPGNLGPECGM
jgi:hypothetical protein